MLLLNFTEMQHGQLRSCTDWGELLVSNADIQGMQHCGHLWDSPTAAAELRSIQTSKPAVSNLHSCINQALPHGDCSNVSGTISVGISVISG